MTKRIGGFRRKTRNKLRKRKDERGKIKITQYMQRFNKGDKVLIKLDSALHEGMAFPKFHGRVGKIAGSQGSCYRIKLQDGGKQKILVVHPGHLRKEGTAYGT